MASAGKNSFFYTLGSVIRALASFILLPIYANLLGASGYGQLGLLETISSILLILMTLATERSLYRLYYDYEGEDRKKFISTVFWAICLFGLFVFFVASSMSKVISPFAGDVDPVRVLIPVFLYTFLSAIVSFSQIIMQVEQKGKEFLIVSLAYMFFYNLFALLLLFLYSPSIESMVYATVLANLCLFPIIFKRLRECVVLQFDKRILLSVLKFSLPMFGMVAAGWALSVSDRLFIVNLGSLEDAGVYAMATKFVMVGTMFAAAIYQAYGPLFYSITNTSTYDDANKRLFPMNKFVSSTVCILFVIVALFSRIVQEILLKEEYGQVALYSYFLCVATLIVQQAGLLNLMIYQDKKTLGVSMISVFAGLFSMLFNYILIPKIGSIGAAVCNLGVSVFIFVSTWILAKRHYYIKLSYGIIFYSILIILVYYLLDLTLEDSNNYIVFGVKVLITAIWTYVGVKINIVDVSYYKIYKDKIKRKLISWQRNPS